MIGPNLVVDNVHYSGQCPLDMFMKVYINTSPLKNLKNFKLKIAIF